jgi:tetratricopeptide (TPR) repeat protein/predicted Ser/Thr protein kinase
METQCPDPDLIVRYVDGSLPREERADVERHADGCANCRVALSNIAAGSLAPRSTVSRGEAGEAVDIPAGTAIDRYLVLYRIGRGGMATVYAAYDPELDRKIALKVLHGKSPARLRSEARTLAQLAHPNIVTIYDVGEHDGFLFLAMELVDGLTLREWAAGKTWRELAPVFVGMARALAAAHAKGVVHRDVKPENVLVDRGGVVRVGDFGLATAEPADGIAGTPAYMAPEQRAGEAVPASDQYGLCVTLYEALAGKRPEGAEAPPNAPRAITEAVKRGLADKPEQRFASMALLADALASDPSRRKKQLAAGVVLLSIVGGSAFAMTRRASAKPQCDLAASAATAKWRDVRDGVHKTFVASKHVGAEPVFAAVDQAMTRYLADWGAMSTESCKRTRVRGDQSDALLDLRTRCLDQRLASATALIDVFGKATSPVVDGAVTAVAGLPSIAGCADVEALTAVAPVEKSKRAAVDALQGKLAKAAALQLTGQYAPATEIVKPAVKDATALDYAPVLAQAKWLEGDLLYRAGDYPASVAALGEATQHAARGRDDRTATKALTLMAGVVGYAQGKLDEGMALALAADAWSARAGRVPEDEAELADIRGLLYDAKGEPLKSEPFYKHALALREQLYGKDHLMVALSLNNLAGVPQTLGKLTEARALHERAKAIREKVLGPVSSDLAVTLNAIASIDESEHKFEEAEKGFRRAIAIWEQVLGPDHPDVGAVHNNLGNLLRTKGDYPGAIKELERALAIWKATDNPNAKSAIGNLAITYYKQQDYARAYAAFTEVIEDAKKTLGDKHPGLANYLVNRGQVLDAMNRAGEAFADFSQAVKIFEASVPAGDRRIAWALTILGKHELAQKRVPSAASALGRALAILEADKEARPDELAAARFALARATWETGDRKKSIELATAARDGADDTSVVDTWLKDHSK